MRVATKGLTQFLLLDGATVTCSIPMTSMHFWEIDEITLSDYFWGGNHEAKPSGSKSPTRVSAGIIVAVREGIAVRHVSLNATRLDCAVYHAIEAVKVDDDVLFEAILHDLTVALS